MKKKILIVLFLIIIGTVARSQAVVSEGSLKAAFIYRFIGFIEFKEEPPGYQVCIPDDTALRAAIEEAMQGKMVNNKPITVTDSAGDCHILISDNVPPTNSVFTIGPLSKGALLEFRIEDSKLRFAVSLKNIQNSQLKISSQLLKLAILEKG